MLRVLYLARSSGRRDRPEKARQLLRAGAEPERRPARPQGHTGGERPGIDRVVPEPIDELDHHADRGAVIAGGGDGDAIRRASRTPGLFQFVVAKLIETLDHARRGEPRLDDDARSGWRGSELVIDAIDRLPIVHRVDEDLAGKVIVWQLAEPVRGHGQDDEAGLTDDLGGGDGARRAGDGRAQLAGADDAQAEIAGLSVGHGSLRRWPLLRVDWTGRVGRDLPPAARGPEGSLRGHTARWTL